MAKAKSVFFCKECGYESSKWLGQCPGCRNWNTFTEEAVAKTDRKSLEAVRETKVQLLKDVSSEEEERIHTGIKELDRVLGGGMVRGSLVLVGGDPGIGKSTLLLQMCKALTDGEQKHTIIYVSGEESARQIKMRADRLGDFSDSVYLYSETDLALIEAVIRKDMPEIVIIDSIQTMYQEDVGSAPGSVGQVREATAVLMKMAKTLGITIFIVGHVTKEGTVAGPKMLEHMVDTVLYFEGENSQVYRILRAVKNRFGSTNEIGVFEMNSTGLKEVANPSAYMLEGKPENEPGSVVTATIEGTRPILIEVQALVTSTNFNLPRRTAAGTDYNRVNLLMAVIEKRLGMSLGGCDAYINVAGGMKVLEPGIDLAIVAAILSSYKNRALDSKTIAFGEVGLTGEVRSVSMAAQRIQEAKKQGYEVCIVPKSRGNTAQNISGIKIIEISSIRQLMEVL